MARLPSNGPRLPCQERRRLVGRVGRPTKQLRRVLAAGVLAARALAANALAAGVGAVKALAAGVGAAGPWTLDPGPWMLASREPPADGSRSSSGRARHMQRMHVRRTHVRRMHVRRMHMRRIQASLPPLLREYSSAGRSAAVVAHVAGLAPLGMACCDWTRTAGLRLPPAVWPTPGP